MTQAQSQRSNRLHPGKHCTRYEALHPLRGATPVTSHCTRSEEVQCPRIGCSTSGYKHHCRQFWQNLHTGIEASVIISQPRDMCDSSTKPTKQPASSRQALHPLRGAAPVTRRCTRYEALHPLRRTTPNQKRCNAHGSGAPTLPTKTFTATRSRHTPSDGHTATAGSRRSNRLHPGKHCTRYEVLHPLRGTAPDQKRCNAHGSGAPTLPTKTFTATQSR